MRTLTEIENEILAAKTAEAGLNSLNSTSKVALWRLWVSVVAISMYIQETLWDLFRVEILDLTAKGHVHTLRWYRDQTLLFRNGKQLIWNGNNFEYPELLPAENLDVLQIVDQAAVLESPSKLLIKVAHNNAGILQPVTAPQKTSIEAYLELIKDAGNVIEVVNASPDDLQFIGTIYVDPLVIKLSDGSLISDASIKPVEAALQAYINAESLLNFNGELRRTFVVDALQQATGVIDPIITSMKSRYAVLAYAEITEGIIPFAGYFTINSMTFTYKAYGS